MMVPLRLHDTQTDGPQQLMFGRLHINEEPREVHDASSIGVTKLYAAGGAKRHHLAIFVGGAHKKTCHVGRFVFRPI
jgi:hypothetical protein